MSARLVLVVAPAGWGKTSLLCDWCAVCEPERTAWLSVDQGDNDPVRFWAHLIAAVDTVSPGIGTVALEVLAAPGVKTADAVLDPVINDFARMPVRVTLVVDDYHLITSQAIQECVEFLVEHLPPTLCLLLATRSDPALPLARLRARGQMTEIRADELRFSEAEAEELLNQTLGLALPPDEVHALQQRTEGWAAGLYLAGLSLRGRKDTALIVRAFSGDDRQIVDYFAAEVLDGLPPRVRVHGIWKSGETGGLRRAGERCYSSDRGQPDPGCHGRAGQPQNDWHPRPFVSRPAGRPLAAGKIAGSGASCSPRPRNKRCQRPPFPRR
jgi:LuxR family maltose regulon positive regulatory protein